MVQVTFNAGRYISELVKRMERLSVSQAELGRAMEPAVSPTQVTRWFTDNPTRRRQPSLETIERIEIAMVKLERQHSKRKGE